jgi:hypothetical protein
MHPPPLLVMDFVGPVIGALVFVLVMSLVSEPARRTINAMIVAGASGAYLSGGGLGFGRSCFPRSPCRPHIVGFARTHSSVSPG